LTVLASFETHQCNNNNNNDYASQLSLTDTLNSAFADTVFGKER
jgi:hypothetical protein